MNMSLYKIQGGGGTKHFVLAESMETAVKTWQAHRAHKRMTPLEPHKVKCICPGGKEVYGPLIVQGEEYVG